MLSAIVCLTVFSALVSSSGSPLDHFQDVSDNWPKEHVTVPDGSVLTFVINEGMSNDQALDYCASQCLRYSYFCHFFALISSGNDEIGHVTRDCVALSALSSKFPQPLYLSSSRNQPNLSYKRVLAVYEQKTTPSEQELTQRYSFEDPKHISEKYGISQNSLKFSITVLKHVKRALHGKLPTAVNIEKWLIEKDIPTSKLYLGKDFKREIMQGLQSWKSWPEHTDAPMQFTDLFVLTFLEIFFTSLDQGIQTIFDPVAKILIVEGSETHMLIHSFGPGDFVILIARNSIEKGVIDDVTCSKSGFERFNINHKVVNQFKQAMDCFNHKVSLNNGLYSTIFLYAPNKLEREVNAIVSAIGVVLLDKNPSIDENAGLNVLLRDIATAVMANLLENESQNLQQTLHQTLKWTNFQSDLDIITQNGDTFGS